MSSLNPTDMLAKILDTVQGNEQKLNSMQEQMNSMQGQITSMNDRLINVEALAIENKNQIATLKLKVDDLDTTLAKIIEQELQPVVAKVDVVISRVESVENRVQTVENKLDTVIARVDSVEAKTDTVIAKVDEFQTQLSINTYEVDMLQIKLGKLSIDQRKLAEQINQERQS